jgi:hypothetical protein
MAAFPSWVQFSWRDLGEAPESVVERAEMERGIPKQRRVSSDARVELPLTLYFDTKTQAADFETWFYVTVNAGQDFFDFTHPRLGTTVQARVVGGQLGPLMFEQPTLHKSNRSLVLEFWRQAW